MFNNTGMHVLNFRLHLMFLCFILGKCSVNRPQAGRAAEHDT